MRKGTRKDRGAALVVALLVMTIIAFLGGLLLLMSQGERRSSSTFRQASVAFGNAEAGLETLFNQIPVNTVLQPCTVPDLSCNGMAFSQTRKDGSPAPKVPQGQQLPQPGFNLDSWDWIGYHVVVTGTSNTFLVFVNQAVEIDMQAVIPTCGRTNYC